MAELNVFCYRSGNTALHCLDIRCKLVILLLVNIVALNGSLPAQLLLTLILVTLLIRQKISIIETICQIRMFLLLLLFVLISRSIFEPGAAVLSTPIFTISRQGVYSGLNYCWRLLLAFVGGLLFISSSKTVDIKAGIQWILKPVPFIPENRIATMISLMIRFLPLILEQAQEISEAQKARAVENCKNPIKRLVLFTIPLLRRIFETADSLVLAMEARCYSEVRTDPELILKASDIMALIGTVLLTIPALLL
jgi:energy-coupling factor transporter transmembrane protein EcfT